MTNDLTAGVESRRRESGSAVDEAVAVDTHEGKLGHGRSEGLVPASLVVDELLEDGADLSLVGELPVGIEDERSGAIDDLLVEFLLSD